MSIDRTFVTRRAPLLLAGALACAAPAFAAAELSGQWVGTTRLDGNSSEQKTTLMLGAADGANSSLRLEGRAVCALRDGRYSEGADGSWTLTFASANGTEACERLAKGTFTLRAQAPRRIAFVATYPGPDGQTNERSGVLNRYP